jgi:hypothetical protein
MEMETSADPTNISGVGVIRRIAQAAVDICDSGMKEPTRRESRGISGFADTWQSQQHIHGQ